jgi:hypothetical protein
MTDDDLGKALILRSDKVYISSSAYDTRVVGFYGYNEPYGKSSITNEVTSNIAYVVGIGDSYHYNEEGVQIIHGCKVCNENGPINVGDLLTTSSRPGYFMKQNDDIIRSYTAGKAGRTVLFTDSPTEDSFYCVMMCG